MTAAATPESTRMLVIANLVTLALALGLNWPMDVLLWPYWIQSAVIGYFAHKRLVLLEESAATQPAQDSADAVPREADAGRSISAATFFAILYGGWFLLFFALLLQNHTAKLDGWDVLGIAAAGVAFAGNHWFSFRQNSAADAAGTPSLLTGFFAPFLRALPMFIGGYAAQELALGMGAVALIAFCLAKTAIDVALHRGEHGLLQKNRRRLPAGAADL